MTDEMLRKEFTSKGHGHSSLHRAYYRAYVRAYSLFRFKLMAFKVPHNLILFNINIHSAFVSSVAFTTKHRSSTVNSETSNDVGLHWPPQYD